MIRPLAACSFALGLAACSGGVTLQKPVLPPLTDGAAFLATSGPRVTGPQDVALGGDVFRVKGLSGPLAFDGVPVCDALRVALVEGLGVPTTCTATGSFWFHSGGDVSAAEAFRALLLVLERAGATVNAKGGVLAVSGALGQAGGFAASGEVESVAVESLGGGAFAYAPSELPAAVPAVVDLLRVSTPSAQISVLPGDAMAAEALQQIAHSAGYSVSARSDGKRVFLYGPANEVALVQAVERTEEERTVSLKVGSVNEATVSALTTAFPDLKISHDAEKSVLYVRGFGADLEAAMPALRVHIEEPRQVRLDAAFVEWSSNRDVTFATALEGASGRLGVDAGARLDGNTFTLSGGLSGSLSAIEAMGSASVLATPSLTVLDGRSARFVSGDQVPVLGEVKTEDGETTQSVEYRDTGVVLNVSAAHAEDGTIRIDATIEVTAVKDEAGVMGNPVFSTRLVQTSIRVTDGQSVVISGLSQDVQSRASKGLPVIGRGGVLGQMVRGRDRSELLFVVTPRLLGASGAALRDTAF